MGLDPETHPPDLGGQVALVTGGGRGIGRAIAEALAAAGAAVAVVARSEGQVAEAVESLRRSGARAVAIPADVSDPASVERMAREVERALGPLDLLVNNAGVAGPLGPIAENDPAEWWRCQEVNLRGPFLCARAVLPGMIARRRGRIVNVASGAGTWAIPYLSAYVVSKTALIRLTEVLAAEVAAHGVSAFAIEPGTVRTAMAEHALQSEGGRRWLPWLGAIFDEGRDVPAAVAARLVLLLASGRADPLSGRFFTVADDVLGLAARGELGDLQTLRLRTAPPDDGGPANPPRA
jgi:NAD(P)-dependent dehydrogenase (short-subunit alcohol dehydrogenase family)